MCFISLYSVLNTLSEYPYFHISKNITSYTFLLVLNIKSLQCILKSFGNSWGNSYTKVVILAIRLCLLMTNWTSTKTNFQNIMTRTVWKFSFALYIFSNHSGFWKKLLIWLRKVSSIKKLAESKVQSFLKWNS